MAARISIVYSRDYYKYTHQIQVPMHTNGCQATCLLLLQYLYNLPHTNISTYFNYKFNIMVIFKKCMFTVKG